MHSCREKSIAFDIVFIYLEEFGEGRVSLFRFSVWHQVVQWQIELSVEGSCFQINFLFNRARFKCRSVNLIMVSVVLLYCYFIVLKGHILVLEQYCLSSSYFLSSLPNCLCFVFWLYRLRTGVNFEPCLILVGIRWFCICISLF